MAQGPTRSIPSSHPHRVPHWLVGGTPPYSTLCGRYGDHRASRNPKSAAVSPQKRHPPSRAKGTPNQERNGSGCEEGGSTQIDTPQPGHHGPDCGVKHRSRHDFAQAGKARYESQSSRTAVNQSLAVSWLDNPKRPQESAPCRRTVKGVGQRAGESNQNTPPLAPGNRSLKVRQSVRSNQSAGGK